MISKSNCKINLGLNIESRRTDGYHEISTLMYPVNSLFDLVEVQPSKEFSFSSSGIVVDCDPQKNLCVRALRLMQQHFAIGEARIHLHKKIPTGAGLGGGSANATTILKLCNEIWHLNLSVEQLQQLAAEIGSDTPFFVLDTTPQMATGRGEILTPFNMSLKGLWLKMVKPDIGVSTAEAYSGIKPHQADPSIQEVLHHPISEWRSALVNDFESSIFENLPLLRTIKEQIYHQGAIYASMSGSGSTIYGIFDHRPQPDNLYFSHIEQM